MIGHWFWNGNRQHHDGSTIICRSLGYSYGSISEIDNKNVPMNNNLYVGNCKSSDMDILKCTGGFNYYEINRGVEKNQDGSIRNYGDTKGVSTL